MTWRVDWDTDNTGAVYNDDTIKFLFEIQDAEEGLVIDDVPAAMVHEQQANDLIDMTANLNRLEAMDNNLLETEMFSLGEDSNIGSGGVKKR